MTEEATLATWRDEITHPNNRLLFRRMVEAAGIDLRTDTIASALQKVAALRTSAPDPSGVVERMREATELLRDAQYHLRVDAWAEHFNGRVNDFLAALSLTLSDGRPTDLGDLPSANVEP